MATARIPVRAFTDISAGALTMARTIAFTQVSEFSYEGAPSFADVLAGQLGVSVSTSYCRLAELRAHKLLRVQKGKRRIRRLRLRLRATEQAITYSDALNDAVAVPDAAHRVAGYLLWLSSTQADKNQYKVESIAERLGISPRAFTSYSQALRDAGVLRTIRVYEWDKANQTTVRHPNTYAFPHLGTPIEKSPFTEVDQMSPTMTPRLLRNVQYDYAHDEAAFDERRLAPEENREAPTGWVWEPPAEEPTSSVRAPSVSVAASVTGEHPDTSALVTAYVEELLGAGLPVEIDATERECASSLLTGDNDFGQPLPLRWVVPVCRFALSVNQSPLDVSTLSGIRANFAALMDLYLVEGRRTA